ncbi:MAG: acyl-ACP--UDP-N-acetylglucosamine O-acyltransferase [Myxococcota bacterium]|nr:acyl-ACP--UDP-N-acetylglucosamine O-acyltransferase [Myxococcota bacterium]
MPRIHPTAVVEPGAVLGDDVEIGPLAVVGPEVELAAGVTVGAHASIIGRTRIGSRTRVFPYVCLGGEPQIKDFQGEATRLEIGRGNVIREHATIHVGSPEGGGCTRIGDDNLIMNTAHVGHDCEIGSHCIIASFCGLAGHVRVEDHAVLGAYTGVHQHTRVGESVMAASNAKLSQDAPPFAMVAGDRARLVGVNHVGLKRRNFSRDTMRSVKHAFHIVFHSRLRLDSALARVRQELSGSPEVARLVCFLETSDRGFCR